MDINHTQYKSFDWVEQNREYMIGCSTSIASMVSEHLDRSYERKAKLPKIGESQLANVITRILKLGHDNNYRLSQLVTCFNLSDTETFIILVCMAAELIPSFSRLLSTYHGDIHRTYPTFGAVASLFDRFDSRAMAHKSSLEAYSLLRIEQTSDPFNEFPLSIDVDIYNYLLGEPYSDRVIESVTREVSHNQLERLSESVANPIVDKAVTLFRRSLSEQYGSSIQLSGTDDVQKRSIVAAIALKLGGGYLELNYFKVPTQSQQLHLLAVRLGRFMKLTGSLLYIKADRLESQDKGRTEALRDLIDTIEFPIIISTIEPMDWGISHTFNHEVSVPDERDQLALWRAYLTPQLLAQLEPDLPKLVSQFNLTAPAIKAIALGLDINISRQGQQESTMSSLWQACRVQARQKLDSLATRIDSLTNWDNLILPEGVRKSLNDIVAQVGLKHIVYQQWGMGGNRGLGIAALFSGVSGTGKTTAAEAIANELKLDLYKIDLSTVISKYIGETEKNLRRIFDAAEAGGAILLFDEADALFGKRTEVKDSKDRHSNAEISYLLQKMEAYSGLAILTTNLPDAIDSAFKRRLRFVVEFAYPDAVAQERIWRSAFGGGAPTNGLDYRALAELNLTGGNIRSVALNAAFSAAQASEEIGMKHVVSAALTEAKKLGNDTYKLEVLASRLKLNQNAISNYSSSSISDSPQSSSSSNSGNNHDRQPSDNVLKPTTSSTEQLPSTSPNQEPECDRSPQQIYELAHKSFQRRRYLEGYELLKQGVKVYPRHSGLNFWMGFAVWEVKLDVPPTEVVAALSRASSGNGQWLGNDEAIAACWFLKAQILERFQLADAKTCQELYKRYLKAYPQGTYSQTAKSRRDELAFEVTFGLPPD